MYVLSEVLYAMFVVDSITALIYPIEVNFMQK